MDSFVKKVLSLLKKGATKHHNTCSKRYEKFINKCTQGSNKFTRGSIANFVVLGLRQLDHQFGHLAHKLC